MNDNPKVYRLDSTLMTAGAFLSIAGLAGLGYLFHLNAGPPLMLYGKQGTAPHPATANDLIPLWALAIALTVFGCIPIVTTSSWRLTLNEDGITGRNQWGQTKFKPTYADLLSVSTHHCRGGPYHVIHTANGKFFMPPKVKNTDDLFQELRARAPQIQIL